MLGSAIQRDLSQRALEEATQQLESRVVVRTAELAALNQALQQEINERRQAETTLRRQAQIIDQVADTVFCTDLDNRVVFWNRGAERLTGYTTEEATGRPISFLYLPEDYVSLQNCIHLLTQSGQHEYETRILRKDGSLRHAWISLSLLHDEAGATTGMSGYAVDITGQKRTQEALQESEGRLRAFVDAMPDVAFILDEDGRYIEVLAHDDTLLYDTKTKLQGKLLHEVFPADDADRYVAVIRRTLETGLSQSHDYEIRVGAGNLWFEARTAPIVGASASKRCVVWVARDVTPRKLALEELRSAHEQLRATLNALPDLLFEVDRDLRIRDYRAPDSTRLFAPPDAFLGRRIAEVLPPEAAEIVLGACEKAFQHGRHMGAVYSLPMPTGVQWYQLSISIKGEAGSTDARLIAMARDITEVKQAERAMQASEQRYRLLAETAQDFIFIIDREDRVAYANTYAGRQFKCSPEQLVGRKRSELFPSPGMGHQQENLRAVFTSGRTISVEHPTPFPDETLWLHTRLVPLPDERGEVTAVLGISRDMTEHRRAAAALSASEEKYRTLVESLDVGILQSTLLPEPRFTHANIACARILGYASVEALMACSPTSIYVDAADRDVYLSVLRRQGAVRNHELRIRRPDGSEAMVSITATVRFNTQGEMMLLDGVVEDVTERRKAEDYLRLLSAAVEQSAAGIAVADPRGMVLFVNEAFAAMHGLSREATPGKHLSIFHLPEQMEQVYAANDDVLHAGRFRGVVWHARRGGRAFPALMNVSPLHDAGGRMAGFIASALDISDQVQAEAQRERLSRAVENAGEGIGTFDDSWALTYANPALARIFAAPLPALLGRSWQELFELPDGAGFQEMANALRHQERWAGRLLGKSTDGRSLPLSMTLVRMAQPEGGELIVANIRDQSEEAMHLLQIRKLTLEAAASLENERARLSRELHDELGQMLTAINLNLAWLSARGAAWEDVARQRLMETQQLVNQLLDAVRTLSTNLRPPILDNRGLLEAIRSYAGGFARRAGFTCRIHAAPADLEVRDPLATTVFRIIQEALTNVARHSRASKCGIFLKFSGAHLEVKIRDNGVGAVASRLDGVQSLGIAGMRERAKAAGGMLKVENRVEGGVCVVAQLPWNQ